MNLKEKLEQVDKAFDKEFCNKFGELSCMGTHSDYDADDIKQFIHEKIKECVWAILPNGVDEDAEDATDWDRGWNDYLAEVEENLNE